MSCVIVIDADSLRDRAPAILPNGGRGARAETERPPRGVGRSMTRRTVRVLLPDLPGAAHCRKQRLLLATCTWHEWRPTGRSDRQTPARARPRFSRPAQARSDGRNAFALRQVRDVGRRRAVRGVGQQACRLWVGIGSRRRHDDPGTLGIWLRQAGGSAAQPQRHRGHDARRRERRGKSRGGAFLASCLVPARRSRLGAGAAPLTATTLPSLSASGRVVMTFVPG